MPASYTLQLRHAACAALLLVSAACGGGDAEDTAATDSLSTSLDTTAAPAGPTLGDGEIAAILATADTGEIAPSQLATQNGQNAQVKTYAQRMVTDHGALSDSLRAMTQANGITPTPNPVSQQLQTQTQTTVQSLQSLTGAQFDRAYMDAMVQSHQGVLNTIDSQFLPAAQNAQLRSALEQKVRPAVAMHLQEAQEILSSLPAN